MSNRHTLIFGALAAAVGVGLGAFGAHGLEERLLALGYETNLSQRLDWFETGVKYQLYHALGLVVVSLLGMRLEKPLRGTSRGFLLGIALFSGSLYAMTFLSDDWKKLGAVVPLGGLSFIVGWILLAYGAWRSEAE